MWFVNSIRGAVDFDGVLFTIFLIGWTEMLPALSENDNVHRGTNKHVLPHVCSLSILNSCICAHFWFFSQDLVTTFTK